ncbi:hypothetical protein IAT38_001275 [Cryptococcus sp. DSM 104549]
MSTKAAAAGPGSASSPTLESLFRRKLDGVLEECLEDIGVELKSPLKNETNWQALVMKLEQAAVGSFRPDAPYTIRFQAGVDLEQITAVGGLSLHDSPLHQRYMRHHAEAAIFRAKKASLPATPTGPLKGSPLSGRPWTFADQNAAEDAAPVSPTPLPPSVLAGGAAQPALPRKLPAGTSTLPTDSILTPSPSARPFSCMSSPAGVTSTTPRDLNAIIPIVSPETRSAAQAASVTSEASEASEASDSSGVRKADLSVYVVDPDDRDVGTSHCTGEFKVISRSILEQARKAPPSKGAALVKKDIESKHRQGLAQALFYSLHAFSMYNTRLGFLMVGTRWTRLLVLDGTTVVLELKSEAVPQVLSAASALSSVAGEEAVPPRENTLGNRESKVDAGGIEEQVQDQRESGSPKTVVTVGPLFRCSPLLLYSAMPHDFCQARPEKGDTELSSIGGNTLNLVAAQELIRYFEYVRFSISSTPITNALHPLPLSRAILPLEGLTFGVDSKGELDLAASAHPRHFPMTWVDSKKLLINKGRGNEHVDPSYRLAGKGKGKGKRKVSLDGSPSAVKRARDFSPGDSPGGRRSGGGAGGDGPGGGAGSGSGAGSGAKEGSGAEGAGGGTGRDMGEGGSSHAGPTDEGNPDQVTGRDAVTGDNGRQGQDYGGRAISSYQSDCIGGLVEGVVNKEDPGEQKAYGPGGITLVTESWEESIGFEDADIVHPEDAYGHSAGSLQAPTARNKEVARDGSEADDDEGDDGLSSHSRRSIQNGMTEMDPENVIQYMETAGIKVMIVPSERFTMLLDGIFMKGEGAQAWAGMAEGLKRDL